MAVQTVVSWCNFLVPSQGKKVKLISFPTEPFIPSRISNFNWTMFQEIQLSNNTKSSRNFGN